MSAKRYVILTTLGGGLPTFHAYDGWITVNFRDAMVWSSLNLATSCVDELNARCGTNAWRLEPYEDLVDIFA